MLWRNIERLEVVVLVLDLRSVGGRENEPPPYVLQRLRRRRDRGPPAQPQRPARQRQIELRPRFRSRARRFQPCLRRLKTRFDLRLDFVEPLPRRRLILLADRTESFLHILQPSLRRAEELNP